MSIFSNKQVSKQEQTNCCSFVVEGVLAAVAALRHPVGRDLGAVRVRGEAGSAARPRLLRHAPRLRGHALAHEAAVGAQDRAARGEGRRAAAQNAGG
jgi:hypothetical protein